MYIKIARNNEKIPDVRLIIINRSYDNYTSRISDSLSLFDEQCSEIRNYCDVHGEGDWG